MRRPSLSALAVATYLLVGFGWANLTAARVYEVGELDHYPVQISAVRPVYPLELRRQQVEGRALIEFVVAANGTVAEAKVLNATHPEFGDAAMGAVRQWRFRPGMLNNVPVNTGLKVPVVFSLEGDQPQGELPPDRELEGPIIGFSDADVKPTPRFQQKPVFPPDLQAQGIKGEAVIEFVVDQEGYPRRIRAVRVTHDAFGDAAMTAIARWRFTPGQVNGEPVNVVMVIPMVFNIKN